MTQAVKLKFDEGKAYYEKGETQFLPALKAVQSNPDINANSTEYKQLVKMLNDMKTGESDLNNDGHAKGKDLTEKELAVYLAKIRNKK